MSDTPTKEELQEIADEIINIPGKTKGVTFQTAYKYISRRKGEEGVKKVEQTMKELGYDFSFSDIDNYSWYPEGKSVLVIYLTRPLFGWGDDDIYDMGYSAASISRILKVAMSFVSLERTFNHAERIWDKHYNFGNIEPVELDEDGKKAVVKLHDYRFPHMEEYFCGYFSRLVELLTGSDEAKTTHKPCESKDKSPCDEFVTVWK